MPARSELADALVECLRDVASSLETGLTVAFQQQDALTRSDAEAISMTCASQEEILRRISQADERAAAVAGKIAEESGIDAAASDAQAIARAAGAPFEATISRELSNVSNLARQLRDANETNARLLRNGLEVISSCLRIIVREPEPVVYSRSASFGGSLTGVLALDSRV